MYRNPWDCADCNVRYIGQVKAYNDSKNGNGVHYIAKCEGYGTDITNGANGCIPTTTTATTTTATATSTVPTQLQESSSSSVSVFIGVVVGVLLFMAIVLFFLVRWQRGKSKDVVKPFEGIKDKPMKDISNNDHSKKSTRGKFSAFLTHDWGTKSDGHANHKRVAEVHRLLTEKGYDCWFDAEAMKDNINLAIRAGIDDSECAIIFITQRYLDKINSENPSDNCFKEFRYIFLRKKQYILVLMDGNVCPANINVGYTGFTIGDDLYINMTKNLDADVLVEELKRKGVQPNITPTSFSSVDDVC